MKYYYITILTNGIKRIELIKAENRDFALEVIKNRFENVVIVKIIETANFSPSVIDTFVYKYKKVFVQNIPLDEHIVTIKQIAIMSDAGITMTEILEDIIENVQNKALKEMYKKIKFDINAGKSISNALSNYNNEYAHIILAMTRLGEQTGDFANAYHFLSDILENIKDNTIKLKKAIRGPIVTVIGILVSFVILITLVVPKFKDLFTKFNTELPFSTKILLYLEEMFSSYGGIILLIFFIISLSLKYLYIHNEKFKYTIDTILIHPKFYFVNKTIFYSEMYKYHVVLSELLRAGIPIMNALKTAENILNNAVIKRKLAEVKVNISKGMNFSEALQMTGLYEKMHIQMIKSGELSGQIDVMLQKVTQEFKTKFQTLIDNLTTYIEPVMLIFIAGLVLLMALGIFMPMWDLSSAMKV